MSEEKTKKPFYKKWWVWLIAIIIIAIAASGGGDEEVATEEENNEVELSLDTEFEGDTLRISGSTNLPDDTLIAFEVTHDDEFELFEEGHIAVENGKYQTELDLSDWPSGEIRVWVAFQTILGTSVHQPDFVIEQFGEMGENIEGENVTEAGGMKRVELESTVTKEPESVEEPEEATEEEATEEASAPEADVPREWQNALDMARNYLHTMPFSHSGLADQLSFEGFPDDAIEWAMEQIDQEVDWTEQAVRMAENYLNTMSMSKDGLIEQLMFEGFFREDAEHAANVVFE